MKNIFLALALAFCSLQVIAHPNVPINWPIGWFPKKVVLKAGTPIIFETAEDFNSESLSVGQVLKFAVKMHVMAEGQVAIRTGAIAIGRVKANNAATYNHPANVTLELTSVQSVDGQQIALNGTEQTFLGKFTNESTKVHNGMTILATVLNDVIIKTK